MSTKRAILASLHRRPRTVADLCEELGVTRTAVNVQIRQLLAERLIVRLPPDPRGAVGKPAALYDAAPGSEDAVSAIHRDFLSTLVGVMIEELPPRARCKVLDSTGRRLARAAGLHPTGDFDVDIGAAARAANAVGAQAEIESVDGGTMVRNRSCPLANAVRLDGHVCQAMAAFFSEATGHVATERCVRADRLTCQYLVKRPAVAA